MINFNTSYVVIKLFTKNYVNFSKKNFNTSYVVIKLEETAKIPFGYYEFQYILCCY